MTDAAFPRLFHEYYAIHETIHALLEEDSGNKLQVEEIAGRLLEKHPDLSAQSAMLAEAIRQAIRDTESVWRV